MADNNKHEQEVADNLYKCEGFADISKCFAKLHVQLKSQKRRDCQHKENSEKPGALC